MADTRVFVCSTCYDLIDVRAEVEQLLRDGGYLPVLSDSTLSDFQIDPNADSIETCLSNVRRSDVFIMILSLRYGPSLLKAGFKDVSACHLEYREARKLGVPRYIYVRDHLEGAYAHWKKQKRRVDFKSPWVGENDFGLFRLLDEHSKLVARGKANWYTTFRSSTDLKATLFRDLRVAAPSAILRKRVAEAKVPELRIVCTQSIPGRRGNPGEFALVFNNHGTVPAHRVALRITTEADGNILQCFIADAILPGVLESRKVQFVRVDSMLPFVAELLYELSDGMQIGELFHCQFRDNVPVFVHQGKWHIGQSNKVLAAPVYPWPTDAEA